jgi:DNA-binding HxlR family transcriptional regulator
MPTVSQMEERMLTIQLLSLVKPSLVSRPSHSQMGFPTEYAMQCMMIVLLSRQCICLSRVFRDFYLSKVRL